MSLEREEELEQDPDTAPGVLEGASSTKSFVLLQELSREITSGSVCSMVRGEKAGEAFQEHFHSRWRAGGWKLCGGCVWEGNGAET